MPEGLVHLAGVSLIDPDDPGDVDHLSFGGYPEVRPDQWARGDLYRRLGGNPDRRVAIIFELRDPVPPGANAPYLHDSRTPGDRGPVMVAAPRARDRPSGPAP